MDKYKKIVLKLLRIYGRDAMRYMKQFNDRKGWYKTNYGLSELEIAMSNYKTYKEYKIIPERAIKGYHSEWI